MTNAFLLGKSVQGATGCSGEAGTVTLRIYYTPRTLWTWVFFLDLGVSGGNKKQKKASAQMHLEDELKMWLPKKELMGLIAKRLASHMVFKLK